MTAAGRHGRFIVAEPEEVNQGPFRPVAQDAAMFRRGICGFRCVSVSSER